MPDTPAACATCCKWGRASRAQRSTRAMAAASPGTGGTSTGGGRMLRVLQAPPGAQLVGRPTHLSLP